MADLRRRLDLAADAHRALGRRRRLGSFTPPGTPPWVPPTSPPGTPPTSPPRTAALHAADLPAFDAADLAAFDAARDAFRHAAGHAAGGPETAVHDLFLRQFLRHLDRGHELRLRLGLLGLSSAPRPSAGSPPASASERPPRPAAGEEAEAGEAGAPARRRRPSRCCSSTGSGRSLEGQQRDHDQRARARSRGSRWTPAASARASSWHPARIPGADSSKNLRGHLATSLSRGMSPSDEFRGTYRTGFSSRSRLCCMPRATREAARPLQHGPFMKMGSTARYSLLVFAFAASGLVGCSRDRGAGGRQVLRRERGAIRSAGCDPGAVRRPGAGMGGHRSQGLGAGESPRTRRGATSPSGPTTASPGRKYKRSRPRSTRAPEDGLNAAHYDIAPVKAMQLRSSGFFKKGSAPDAGRGGGGAAQLRVRGARARPAGGPRGAGQGGQALVRQDPRGGLREDAAGDGGEGRRRGSAGRARPAPPAIRRAEAGPRPLPRDRRRRRMAGRAREAGRVGAGRGRSRRAARRHGGHARAGRRRHSGLRRRRARGAEALRGPPRPGRGRTAGRGDGGRAERPRGGADPEARAEPRAVALAARDARRRAHPREHTHLPPRGGRGREAGAGDARGDGQGGQPDADLQRRDADGRVQPLLERAARSIAREETIPALMRDPSYLAKNNLEVVRNGRVVEPLRRRLVGRGRPHPPAAGRLQFPRPREVHLPEQASTCTCTTRRRTRSSRRVERDCSHGCVRVEKPFELAQWVLRHQREWTPERIQAAMQRRRGEARGPGAEDPGLPRLRDGVGGRGRHGPASRTTSTATTPRQERLLPPSPAPANRVASVR